MNEIIFDDFRNWTSDRFICSQNRRGAKLAPTYLLAHESGFVGDVSNQINDKFWSKTSFDLYSDRIKGAELLFYVNDYKGTRTNPMKIAVNGNTIAHRQNSDRMLTGGWDRKRISEKYLKKGSNIFVFSQNGMLFVDPHSNGIADSQPSNSERSFDSGLNWHTDALGDGFDVCGEYLVRLRVRGYPPQGVLISPVIDTADAKGLGVISSRSSIVSVQVNGNLDKPSGTKIIFEMRSGSTPKFDPRNWSPWQPGAKAHSTGRFVQVRVLLKTQFADKTPIVKHLKLIVNSVELPRDRQVVELIEIDQPEFIHSSYPFAYLKPHSRLDRLRKQYCLDDVIAAGTTEIEQLALLRDWVHSQWLGWQSDKYPYCPSWDPLEILETTKGNWGFGMCTHYGATYAGCASALGWVSRVLIVDHHCLAEVWYETEQKWILQDAGPCREYDANYEINGKPINALELHQALKSDNVGKVMSNKLPQKVIEPMDRYLEAFCRFGIPLRNNHLTHTEPAERHHGYRQYHYDGYLWWSDNANPKYSEYSLQTSRPGDFYWSVNQTRIFTQVSDKPGCLQIQFEHNMPNFSHFSINFKDKEIKEVDSMDFMWELKLGLNEMCVSAVNSFGRKGRVSKIVVNYGGTR